MLARMLFESWKHGLTRKLLSVMSVFLAASLVSALLAVSLDIGDKMAKEMKTYGANILVQPAGQAILPNLDGEFKTGNSLHDYLDEDELPNIKDIFWRNNIVGFAPHLNAEVIAIDSATGEQRSVVVLGTFFDKKIEVPDEPDFQTGEKIISSYWKITGDWVDDNLATAANITDGLIGHQLANKTGWKVGDSILLQEDNNQLQVNIVGILESGGEEENQLILPLAKVQQLVNLVGKVESVKVSALTTPENELSRRARENKEALSPAEYDIWYCTAYVSTITDQLEEAISGSVVQPIWQVAASEGVVISKIQLLLAVVTIATVLAAAMGITSLMTSTIIERSPEIGLMKALGARNWQIMLLFYTEAAISGLLGGVLGCIAGWGLAHFIGMTLFDEALSYTWIVVPSVIIVSIIITLIGTWFPASRITKLYPARVLHGK